MSLLSFLPGNHYPVFLTFEEAVDEACKEGLLAGGSDVVVAAFRRNEWCKGVWLDTRDSDNNADIWAGGNLMSNTRVWVKLAERAKTDIVKVWTTFLADEDRTDCLRARPE